MIRVFLASLLLAATVPPAPVGTPPAPTPTPAREAGPTDEELLARVRARIAGRETDPAESVFKNVELLRGKPAARLPGMMKALTGLIGVPCSGCHDLESFASDDPIGKRTARRHFAMQSALNRDYFGGANAITCWTCHRGARIPPSP